MKTIILILSLVVIAPSMADAKRRDKDNKKDQIDYSTAIVLISESLESDRHSRRSQARKECQKDVSDKLVEVEARVNAGEFNSLIEGDVLFGCTHVIYSVRTSGNYDSNFGTGYAWWTGHYSRNTQIKVACIPRPLSQMQDIAAGRKCIDKPEDHCYSESFRAAVDAVPKTQFIRDYDDKCTVK